MNPSTLDLIITKHPADLENLEFLPPLGKSDHVVLSFCVNVSIPLNPKSKLLYDYSRGSYDEFRDFVRYVDIVSELQRSSVDVDIAFEFIREVVVEGCEKFIPRYTIREGMKKRNNLPKFVLEAISVKNRHWRAYLSAGDDESWRAYKRVRNRATMILRSHTESVESSIISCAQSCPKKYWKHVNRVKKEQSPLSTVFNDPVTGETVDDDKRKAAIFNKTFSSVFVNPATHKISNLSLAPEASVLQNESQYDDSDVAPELVQKIIRELSVDKALDIDGVSNVIMRELASSLAAPLAFLFNLCLESGKCPAAWKKAVIKPLHKGGPRLDFTNYRPI